MERIVVRDGVSQQQVGGVEEVLDVRAVRHDHGFDAGKVVEEGLEPPEQHGRAKRSAPEREVEAPEAPARRNEEQGMREVLEPGGEP